VIASSALRIGRILHTDLLMDAKDGLWRGSAGCAAHRRKRARLARHAPDLRPPDELGSRPRA
jgi:hypothetical protein